MSRRPLRLLFCVSALGLIAVGACGYEKADTPAPPVDAGADTTPPPPVDSGPADAGVDAGPTFCTTQTADFCGDFDRGATASIGWDGIAILGGGEVSLAPATDTSKPNVLRTTFPAIENTAINSAIAQVAKKLDLGGKRHITVSLAAKFSDPKPDAGTHLLTFLTVIYDLGTVALFRGPASWFIGVARRNIGPNDASEPILKISPPLDKWVRLELDIVLARPQGSVKLLIDGQDALTDTIATLGDGEPTTDAEKMTLAVGPSHSSGATAVFDTYYDDVTVKLAP